jgi:hypothetical protein
MKTSCLSTSEVLTTRSNFARSKEDNDEDVGKEWVRYRRRLAALVVQDGYREKNWLPVVTRDSRGLWTGERERGERGENLANEVEKRDDSFAFCLARWLRLERKR